MRMSVFLILTTLESAIWVTILAAAGLLLDAHYAEVGHYIEPVACIIVISIVVFYVYRLITFNRERS